MRSTSTLFFGISLTVAASAVSCTDPVRDQQIAALGDEDPAIPQGPEHRAGQPCVLCHSAGGPASKAPFVIAGTVYEGAKSATGLENVTVSIVDSVGGRRQALTNAAGNFFITEADWRDLAFPFKVAVQKGKDQPTQMSSLVNREGSCNFCHKGVGSYDAVSQVNTKGEQ